MSSPDLAASREPSLRGFALECIAYGLEYRCEPRVDQAEQPQPWRQPGACFVTLRIANGLRGCIGTFDTTQPLVVNVARSAYRAAFDDPRFSPVTREELRALEAKISVLGSPEPFPIDSETDLLEQLRPGIDGLILMEGCRRATFLPAVWEQLPEPADFLDALCQKAGLPPRYWSQTLRFERYTVTEAS